jgi:hypothetical protein
VEWWDCTGGTTISTSATSVTDGTLSVAIPRTSQVDLAYKILSPAGVAMQNTGAGTVEPQYSFHLRGGVLHCTAPTSEKITVEIFSALGRIVKNRK